MFRPAGQAHKFLTGEHAGKPDQVVFLIHLGGEHELGSSGHSSPRHSIDSELIRADATGDQLNGKAVEAQDAVFLLSPKSWPEGQVQLALG